MALVAPELSAKYELISATGNRVVFNDVSDPDYVGPLTEHSGFDSPEIREESENRVGTDGANHGIFLFGRRPLTMTGRVLNPASAYDRAARLDKLQKVVLDCLRSDGILSWTLSTGQALFTRVRTQQPLRIEGAWQKTFQIAMVAADPLLYGMDERVAGGDRGDPQGSNSNDYLGYPNAPQLLPGNAARFPLDFPINWAVLPPASAELAVTTVANNAGDAPVFPTVHVSNAVSPDFYVVNSTNGKSVHITTSMVAGETTTIDMAKKTVTRNGSNAYSAVDTSTSEWWPLEPGPNTINVYTALRNPSIRLQVVWRDAWR